MYDDKSLVNILPGESHCDLNVSAVKAHPHIHKYSALVAGGNLSYKCSSVKKFHKFLLLIRDPFDSIWSEFQRRITGGSHNGRVVRDRAGRYLAAWKRVSRYLAAEYADMWQNNYLPLLRDRTVDTLITRYEDLRNADKRMSELKRIVQFIDAPKISKGMQRAVRFTDQSAKVLAVSYPKRTSKSIIDFLHWKLNDPGKAMAQKFTSLQNLSSSVTTAQGACLAAGVINNDVEYLSPQMSRKSAHHFEIFSPREKSAKMRIDKK
eukprot:gene23267-31593_t